MSQQIRSTEERLVSLLLTLRNTTTGLSAEELVASVPGYALANPSTNPVSARRKFERDKDTLRELGIEVTTTGRPEEPRYRVVEEDYILPALHLSAEQAACLSLAASAWRDGGLPATARRALTKLRAVSEGPTGGSSAGLPVLTADLSGEEIPEELITAVDERRLVTFDYVSARSGSTRARTVEPHHLRLAEGAWYLDAVEPTRTRARNRRNLQEPAPGCAPSAWPVSPGQSPSMGAPEPSPGFPPRRPAAGARCSPPCQGGPWDCVWQGPTSTRLRTHRQTCSRTWRAVISSPSSTRIPSPSPGPWPLLARPSSSSLPTPCARRSCPTCEAPRG